MWRRVQLTLKTNFDFNSMYNGKLPRDFDWGSDVV